MSNSTDKDLKHEISKRLLKHIADSIGITVEEYGSVYDSEYHEQVLDDLMSLFTTHRDAAVREAEERGRIAEAKKCEKARRHSSQSLGDPFDFVEPCEPDCAPERHAYFQGQWDMAERISAVAPKQQTNQKERT